MLGGCWVPSCATVVAHARDVDAETVEVTEAAEQAWVQLLESSSQWFLGNPDCTPGYYNNEGKPIGRRERLNGSGYPEGPAAYFHYIEA
jgi:cyclohexanone monooxygenase